jgi:methionyl-tRNA formyltransferase
MGTLILTDNPHGVELARELSSIHGKITIAQSPNGTLDIPRINSRSQFQELIERYTLILSIHCKQVFPPALVKAVRCVNVHPGYNPFNRGWFPHVFSIINGLKAGVTIHEMDELIDHGPIIVQKEYLIKPWDTSGSVYEAIMSIEKDLVLACYPMIRDGRYETVTPSPEGNINSRKDFDDLREIDLKRRGTYGEFLNHLRALTHGSYRNAFFVDDTGGRVFVRISLEPDQGQSM